MLFRSLLLGLIGTSIYFQRKADENKAGRYRTVAADRGGVVQRITANGTMNPVTVVSVGTQVSGIVTKMISGDVKPGDEWVIRDLRDKAYKK